MKRGWIVLLAAPFIVLGAIVWAFLPAIYALVMFAMQHRGEGCDEGPITDQRWIRSPVHKVAGVNITYVYIMGE